MSERWPTDAEIDAWLAEAWVQAGDVSYSDDPGNGADYDLMALQFYTEAWQRP